MTHSFRSQLKVHRMFNAISQTITDFDNSRFFSSKDVSVFVFRVSELSPAALSSPAVFI